MKKEMKNEKPNYKEWFEEPIPEEIINRILENNSHLCHGLMILNITTLMQKSILLLPKNLLEQDKLFIGEAFEYEKSQKSFSEFVDSLNKTEEVAVSVYEALTNISYNEYYFMLCIKGIEFERNELLENMLNDDAYGIAKNISRLRGLSTAIFFFVDCSKPYFEDNDFLEIYSFFKLAAKSYADQIYILEQILYANEDEE
ncbi:MAG TPA: hypothetical protein OIM45_06225 [Clostridiaceae bacterium]|nr:hypothetical protein [Clostridiaceae bacterium]